MVVGGPVGYKRGPDHDGATNPLDAAPGTVRGDFGLDMGQNVVHSADGLESAEREIGLFFAAGRLIVSPDRDRWRLASPPVTLSDFELILASQSPRRHSLLRDIGVPFRVVLSTAEEARGR